MLRGDERDGLAVVAHAVRGEHRLVRELEAIGLRAGDILMGQHRVDARNGQRLRDVDLDDARVRVRAAKRVTPQHPCGLEVARVGELTLDLGRPVEPENAVADASDGGRCDSAHDAAACRTASKIFA
jgi:hypothetical protein